MKTLMAGTAAPVTFVTVLRLPEPELVSVPLT